MDKALVTPSSSGDNRSQQTGPASSPAAIAHIVSGVNPPSQQPAVSQSVPSSDQKTESTLPWQTPQPQQNPVSPPAPVRPPVQPVQPVSSAGLVPPKQPVPFISPTTQPPPPPASAPVPSSSPPSPPPPPAYPPPNTDQIPASQFPPPRSYPTTAVDPGFGNPPPEDTVPEENPVTISAGGKRKFPIMVATFLIILTVTGFSGSFLYFRMTGKAGNNESTAGLPQITPPSASSEDSPLTEEEKNASLSGEYKNPFDEDYENPFENEASYQNPFGDEEQIATDTAYENPFENL